MQTYHNTTNLVLTYNFEPTYQLSDLIFFDIETTGFSPQVSSLYLIGCCYFSCDTWKTIQWFADDYESEVSLLSNFFDFIKNYKLLIHYNGTGFDIPYLINKCAHYNLDYNFQNIDSLDIYKKLMPYKKLLLLPSLKQKEIERFLSVSRLDPYTGGELIQIYVDFMKSKFHKNMAKEAFLQKLLLHNLEDLKGLLQITAVLSLTDFFEMKTPFPNVIVEENMLILEFQLKNQLPLAYSFKCEIFQLYGMKDIILLKIPFFQGELKYFFSNYKDYYYLPAEDTAIHKSIATYVDKNYKRKAKASDCYSKKTGVFLPLFDNSIGPSFKADYSEKQAYIEVTEPFLKNETTLPKYVASLLHFIKKNKQ